MAQQNVREWRTVKIRASVIAPLEDLVRNAKDEFGEPLFRSKSEAVIEALKEFLRKHSEDEET